MFKKFDKKDIKHIHTVKKILFTNDMILYKQNSKICIQKNIRINKFTELQDTRLMCKILFLNTTNKQLKNRIKKTTPFIKAAKRIKYFVLNLAKEVKVLYIENNKIKKIKHLNK